MKVLVIESSPHKQGSSNLLAEEFIRGAKEAGHDVTVFDAGHTKINPCVGCGACGMSGPCMQKDDMAVLREQLLDSDMTVFVSPLYYFGFSAQLKTVIDRFYSFNGLLTEKRLKTALIVSAWDNNSWTMQDVKAHYETLCRYLNFQNQGEILGVGCGTVQMTKRTQFPKEAYLMGKRIGG